MTAKPPVMPKLADRTRTRMPCVIASACEAWRICGHGVCRRHRICFAPEPACFAGRPPWYVAERAELHKTLRARLGADRPEPVSTTRQFTR